MVDHLTTLLNTRNLRASSLIQNTLIYLTRSTLNIFRSKFIVRLIIMKTFFVLTTVFISIHFHIFIYPFFVNIFIILFIYFRTNDGDRSGADDVFQNVIRLKLKEIISSHIIIFLITRKN